MRRCPECGRMAELEDDCGCPTRGGWRDRAETAEVIVPTPDELVAIESAIGTADGEGFTEPAASAWLKRAVAAADPVALQAARDRRRLSDLRDAIRRFVAEATRTGDLHGSWREAIERAEREIAELQSKGVV